jgi:centromere protein C
LSVGAASPLAYFTDTQNRNRTRNHPSSPLASTRVLGQSSSRPIARSSDVDFDSVPSPQSSRVRRNGSGAGPSNLRQSSVVYGDGEDDKDDGYDLPENDVSPNSNSHSRSQAKAASQSQRTPRKTNFSALANSDSEEEVEQATTPDPPPQSSARKANARIRRSSPSPAVPASDDLPHDQQEQGQEQEYEPQNMDMDNGHDYEMGVEEDIARGLDDVERGGSGEEEEQEEEERPTKTRRVTKGKENAKGSKGKKTGNGKRERKMVEIPRDGMSASSTIYIN